MSEQRITVSVAHDDLGDMLAKLSWADRKELERRIRETARQFLAEVAAR